MDPDATLRLIRTLAVAVRDATTDRAAADDGRELAQAVSDLDDWIEQGGHLPAAWRT